jgi:hypothetical protein
MEHALPMLASSSNIAHIASHGPSTGLNANVQKRFVRDVEDALVETAKESDRQRTFKERESNDLRHRLETARMQSEITTRRLVKNNNHILGEYNELRKHTKHVEQQLDTTKEHLKDLQNQLLQLQLAQASGGRSAEQKRRGDIDSSASTASLSRQGRGGNTNRVDSRQSRALQDVDSVSNSIASDNALRLDSSAIADATSVADNFSTSELHSKGSRWAST